MIIRNLYILLVLGVIGLRANTYAHEPGKLSYTLNMGQWPATVQYKADIGGGSVFLTPNGFRYAFYDVNTIARLHGSEHAENPNIKINCHAYEVSFVNSHTSSLEGSITETAYRNYYIGDDYEKWLHHVPSYAEVSYRELYPGINMNVYSTGDRLKYDLIVQPGADAGNIKMKFDGVTPNLNPNGDIVINTTVNQVVELSPYVYQLVGDNQVAVKCDFKIVNGVLSFDFPDGYNKTKELVIDPALIFATYTGSTGDVWGYCSAFDSKGEFYSASRAFSTGFPTTVGAYQVSFGGIEDIAINKYNATGDTLLYSTYCGGQLSETPTAMVVNNSGSLVVSGRTYSSNYPTTNGAYDNTLNALTTSHHDIFVSVFSSDGSSLLGSTFVGGSGNDCASAYAIHYQDQDKSGLCVDGQNNIYVATTTTSKNFPTTNGAYEQTPGSVRDGVIFKLSHNCGSLIYSTYYGGDHNDCIYDCKLRRDNSLVVCGMSYSSDVDVKANAYEDTGAAFVSILSPLGDSIVASTRLGKYALAALKVSMDDSENVFVCGNNDTLYQHTPGTHYQKNGKVFIAKLTKGLDSLIRTTKLVEAPQPGVAGFVNICGDVVAAIYVKRNLPQPITSNAFLSTPTVYYFLHMGPAMDSLTYATFYGSPYDSVGGSHAHGTSVIDTNGIIWFSACNSQTKNLLQGTSGSYSPTSKSAPYLDNDHLSVKFDMEVLAAKPIASIHVEDTVCVNSDVPFYNESRHAYKFIWYFGDGDTSHTRQPVHKYVDTNGRFIIKLEAYNPYSCKPVDITYDTVFVDTMRITAAFTAPDTLCRYEQVQLVNYSHNGGAYYWDFGDNAVSGNKHPTHTWYDSGMKQIMLVAYNSGFCNKSDTGLHDIYIDGSNPEAGIDADRTKACVDMPVAFKNNTKNGNTYSWDFDDGVTSAGLTPVHSYYQWGNKNVRLIATNNLLCVPDDTAYLPVNIIEPLRASISDTFVCGGEELVSLTVNMIHHNSGVTYAWTPAEAIISGKDGQTVLVDPKLSTRYIVTVSDTVLGLCSHTITDTANLIIVDYPTGTFAESNSPVCAGSTLLLSSGSTLKTPRLVYTWKGPGGYTSTGQRVGRDAVQEYQEGVYSVIIDNEGCEVTETIDVKVKPTPDVMAGSSAPILAGKELQLTAKANMEVDSFIWTGPSGYLSFEQNPIIHFVRHKDEGPYKVSAILDGCIGSAVTLVTVDEPDSQYVHLYPNPNNGTFYLYGKTHIEQEVKIKVLNSLGQTIFSSNVYTKGHTLNEKFELTASAGGIYVMWILMDAEYWSIPFTIARE